MDSLSPERQREIDKGLDRVVNITEDIARAVLWCAKRALWFIPLVIVIAFVWDVAFLHFSQTPTATITIKRYYAVALKNGKTEIDHADPITQMCVNAMFPHRGYAPCWYLRRHNEKEIRL